MTAAVVLTRNGVELARQVFEDPAVARLMATAQESIHEQMRSGIAVALETSDLPAPAEVGTG